jgi:hypothetical protein
MFSHNWTLTKSIVSKAVNVLFHVVSKRQVKVWWNFVSEILPCSYLAIAFFAVLTHTVYLTFFSLSLSLPWHNIPKGPGPPYFLGFTITHTQTHTHTTRGRTPLNELSVHRRDLYLNTQHSQDTSIHVSGGIRTHNPSKRAVADPRLRHSGRRNRRCFT